MKDNQMHDHLDKSSERNFFAKELYDVFWKRKFRNNELEKRNEGLSKFKGFDWTIEHAKLQIEVQQSIIDEAMKSKVLLAMMENLGWKEWDICESIKKSQPESWLSFIGTEEEHKMLIEIVKKETENK